MPKNIFVKYLLSPLTTVKKCVILIIEVEEMGYKQQLEQKRKRDATLYQYHLDHTQISVRDLGRIFKISHGRISQIIKREREADASNK